ncbi:hypothetical protein CA607_20580 [Caulobacter vibrioides]|nr:hypothetical protein CA607_20580 [Caulobacter vibrioides]
MVPVSFCRALQLHPSFPPLWREPLYPAPVREGRIAGDPLASHVQAEPGVPATRAGMTMVLGGALGATPASGRARPPAPSAAPDRPEAPCRESA